MIASSVFWTGFWMGMIFATLAGLAIYFKWFGGGHE